MAKAQNQEDLATPPRRGQFEPRTIRAVHYISRMELAGLLLVAKLVVANLSGSPGVDAGHGMAMCGNTGADQEG